MDRKDVARYDTPLTERKAGQMRHIAFAVGLLIGCSIASAQFYSTTLSLGYSHFDMGHANNLFYIHDGGYFDINAAWQLPNLRVPVLAGLGMSGSGFYDREDGNFGTTLYSDVGLFSLEARAALPIVPRGGRGFFLLPRIGAGLLVDSYAIDSQNINGFINTSWHDGAAFDLRPDLEAGYSWGRVAVGADVSYMLGWGDFGNFSSSGAGIARRPVLLISILISRRYPPFSGLTDKIPPARKFLPILRN